MYCFYRKLIFYAVFIVYYIFGAISIDIHKQREGFLKTNYVSVDAVSEKPQFFSVKSLDSVQRGGGSEKTGRP